MSLERVCVVLTDDDAATAGMGLSDSVRAVIRGGVDAARATGAGLVVVYMDARRPGRVVVDWFGADAEVALVESARIVGRSVTAIYHWIHADPPRLPFHYRKRGRRQEVRMVLVSDLVAVIRDDRAPGRRGSSLSRGPG